MHTNKTSPVKAGVVFLCVLVLVVSTVLPHRVVAAPLTSEPNYLAYPGIDYGSLPCINNFQELEFVRVALPVSENTTLSYKLKVVFCNDAWQVSVGAGQEFGVKYIELQGIGAQALGLSASVTNDGGISAGVTIQESEIEITRFPDSPFSVVTRAKFTRKADLAIKGLQIVSSVVQDTRTEFAPPDYNYSSLRSKSPLLAASIAIISGTLLGLKAAQNAALSASGWFILMPQQALQDMLRRLDPSSPENQLQAYEGGYYPPSREIPVELKNALILRYPAAESASFTQLTAPTQIQSGQTFSFNGWGFIPNGKVLVTFSLGSYDDTTAMELTANSSGELSGQVTLPSAAQLRSGTYLLAAIDSASAQYTALKMMKDPNSTSKLYIAGALVQVMGGTATSNVVHQSQAPVAPQLNCNRVSQFDTKLAYLFSGTYCGGNLSWFSGHPSNGPSATGQGSLFVPANSVVNVSSSDDNGGDKACFSATVNDLAAIGWANRIQWAQVVAGGTCQTSSSAGGYIVHTNQGDFTVNAGQTWDNQQHNRQILGFDEIGTANLVINHHGGASRCWNETKSASSLGSDGDWWLQTKSIVVSSGNCPGNDGELIVYVNNNFQSGEHSRVQAGTTHSYEENNRKGSFKFTKPGMSAIFKVTGGRTRCWNTDVTALGDHEDYGTRTIEIRAYGTNVCPPPPPTPTPIPPAPPTNLTASVNGADEVTLNWTNDVGYNGGTVIWEKHPGQSAFVGSLSVGEGGTSFKYFVASCGQPVEYYVEAVDSDGRKAQSNHVFASTNSCSNMVAPTGFRATPIDYDSVRLDWDNNQSGVWEGYLVSYQKEDGSWVEIWPAGRYQNYFDINGLTPCSKPWKMAVVSYQNSTRSPKSLPVTFMLPGCPTAAPQNFIVTSQPNGTANLSWTAHPHAQSYNIDYSYNGAAFQPFQIGVTSSYNGWGGYSCGSFVRLRLAANTPFGRTDYSEQSFTAPLCASGADKASDQSQLQRLYLPLITR